jgi:general secretion pathway protein G
MTSSRRRRRRRAGFTLVEVLLVLVILVIIASLGITNYARSHRRALVNAARTQVDLLTTLLQQYQTDLGDFPSAAQGLDALVNPPADLPNPEKWGPEPYVAKGRLPLDPWDRPYQYEHDPGAMLPRVWSMGPDGASGTDDDVGNW